MVGEERPEEHGARRILCQVPSYKQVFLLITNTLSTQKFSIRSTLDITVETTIKYAIYFLFFVNHIKQILSEILCLLGINL